MTNLNLRPMTCKEAAENLGEAMMRVMKEMFRILAEAFDASAEMVKPLSEEEKHD